MSKTLRSENDRVIIKSVDDGEKMYGNIVIPDMGKEKPEMGTVIAVGPGRTTEFGILLKVNAKVGDVVLIPKAVAQKLDFEGEEYLIIPDREILATIIESKEEDE